ncbi:MAG: nucleotidyltransferase domain-containing protein [Methylacidiphilaceae bacterium]|nr:nucleotidyltransferase domain-containing protein [Candidatus Methylacidiphilaceae bacterium]
MKHGKPTEATEELRKLLPFCVEACREIYGEGLLALLLFGSVARGNARFDSDLDLLVIAERLPPRRRERFNAFSGRAVAPLEQAREALFSRGYPAEISWIFRTPEELREGAPFFLDLPEEAVILCERGRFASEFLRRIRRMREREGARRIRLAGEECWDFRGPGGKGSLASFALDDTN